jgi:hypothetical protein
VDARRSSLGKISGRHHLDASLFLSLSRPVCEQVSELVHVTALNLPVSYVERDGALEKTFRSLSVICRRQMGDLKNIPEDSGG